LNKSIQVSLSLGSNIERYSHINAGLMALEEEFGEIICSPVYESASVGFKGSPFLNLIVIIETTISLTDVIRKLKAIEDRNGRDRTGPKFSPRTLDIDVVTYGSFFGVLEGIQLPRPELFENAFVLLPLVDLWADELVPGKNMTYQQLWSASENKSQELHVVDFTRR
jgi:2-amino-4-hydroxy-6-hydroxymethyldihydropteridine diphosphokinase